MKTILLVSIVLLTTVFTQSSSAEEQGQAYVSEYVSLWLKDHKYTNFRVVDNKLIIDQAKLEISGAIYDVQEKQKDKSYVVETRLTVKYDNKPLFEEFVAGWGNSPKDAFFKTLNNLCQTTLHPIYSKLLNPDDTHVVKEKIHNGNGVTTFHYSGLGIAGDTIEQKSSENIERLVINELAQIKLTQGIHSAKLVISKVAKKPAEVVFTLDGNVVNSSERFRKFTWPDTKNFYFGKFFVVLSQV